MIVLIGFMGAGKTTTGRLLAERLGLPFFDTDALIAGRAGRSISDLFSEHGEATLRTMEREIVAEALTGPDAVVSLGGGAITDPTTCAALEWHTVIHLDVDYPQAMRRVGHDPGRPMLHFADPRALFDARAPIYARLATHVVDMNDTTTEDAVEEIVRVTGLSLPTGPARVTVGVGKRGYPVIVGPDVADDVGNLVDLGTARRATVITHKTLAEMAKPLVDSLSDAGLEVELLTVPEGEAAKSLEVAGELLERMAHSGLRRDDLVVGFGGGVVCDLAGFVASTYHRGVSVVQVPTTVLAQVDAAIGGKTAVNLASGKNLVGTFHQPVAVICDVSFLRSLPDEEVRSGLAEVVKYGLIADPSLLEMVSDQAAALIARDEEAFASVVRRSVAIKAAVVAADEREEGGREVLNYGHTFGHAIEHTTGMRHGEAIAVGMVAAAHLAVDLGLLPEEGIEFHRAIRPLLLSGRIRSTEAASGSCCSRGSHRLGSAWRHPRIRFVRR
jgi:3-dehydroquinate synthase